MLREDPRLGLFWVTCGRCATSGPKEKTKQQAMAKAYEAGFRFSEYKYRDFGSTGSWHISKKVKKWLCSQCVGELEKAKAAHEARTGEG